MSAAPLRPESAVVGAHEVLRVELAGAVRATLGARTVTDKDLGGRRPRLLLAALVRAPDQALTRDELGGILWDGDLPNTWATALRVAASKARAASSPSGRSCKRSGSERG